MGIRQFNNTFNDTKSNKAPSEPSGSVTARSEHTNTDEEEENDLKIFDEDDRGT